MPRFARIDLPHRLYHIIVRGVERRTIFCRNSDRYDFLSRIEEGISKTATQCLTWALMPNHFHLLIRTGASGLAAFMHPLLTGYVGAFNRRHKRVGHLVQNRFKAILCEDLGYFRELLRYIALNPVRAGLVATPEALEAYPWTGHGALSGLKTVPWQNVNEALKSFGDDQDLARRAYRDYVWEGWGQGERPDLERPRAPQSNLITIESKLDTEIFDLQSVLKQAAQMTGVPEAALLERNRSRPVSEARDLFVFAAMKKFRMRNHALAKILRIGHGSVRDCYDRGSKLDEKCRFLEKLSTREG